MGTDPNTDKEISVGAREAQAALPFRFLPPSPPPGAYAARADAWSQGFAFTRSLLQASGEKTTPTIGGAFFANIGL